MFMTLPAPRKQNKIMLCFRLHTFTHSQALYYCGYRIVDFCGGKLISGSKPNYEIEFKRSFWLHLQASLSEM